MPSPLRVQLGLLQLAISASPSCQSQSTAARGRFSGMDDVNDLESQRHSGDDLLDAMAANLERVSSERSEHCIYRAPEHLHRKNEGAYLPRVVSIGPFHHEDPKYEVAERMKWRYLKAFLRQRVPEIGINECLQAAETWEEPARRYYAEAILHNRAEFMKMLILDGSFIIQYFLLSSKPEMVEEDDPIFHRPWLDTNVHHDLQLLENQLPFFVIEDLFSIAFGSDEERWEQFLQFFIQQNSFPGRVDRVLKMVKTGKIRHILDAVRLSLLPSITREKRGKIPRLFKFMPTATALEKAGVRFKAREVNDFFDIQFTNGVLEIPCIELHDRTIPFWRNLILWEQFPFRHDCYVTNYMMFMHHLIDTTDDVTLLIHRGIINSWLRDSHVVAKFFNSSSEDITLSKFQFYYSTVCRDLNAHCNSRKNRWRATLMTNYFNNPWAIISFTAAVALLLLTIVQAICSILSL